MPIGSATAATRPPMTYNAMLLVHRVATGTGSRRSGPTRSSVSSASAVEKKTSGKRRSKSAAIGRYDRLEAVTRGRTPRSGRGGVVGGWARRAHDRVAKSPLAIGAGPVAGNGQSLRL